jgi:hypothetical protein
MFPSMWQQLCFAYVRKLLLAVPGRPSSKFITVNHKMSIKNKEKVKEL